MPIKPSTAPTPCSSPITAAALALCSALPSAAPAADGTNPPDPSRLTVGRIFGGAEEFKTEDWGPAHWFKDSLVYTTLEVAEKFKPDKEAKPDKDAKPIKM